MGGHWLRHPGVPWRRREEPGVVRLGAMAYCVSDLLLLPLLVCSGYGVQTQIGKNLMILSLVLLRVPFFDK